MVKEPLSLNLDVEGRELIEKHRGWWERRSTLFARSSAGPLGDLWLPLADGTLADCDMELHPDMLDVNRLVGERQSPGPLECHGDYFRTVAAYSRVPWVEAILGAPIHATIQGGSMRAAPFVHSWADWTASAPHWNTAWFNLLIQIVEELRRKATHRTALTQTLMRGTSDLAEAILGPEMMSFASVDHPQELHAFLNEAAQTFQRILDAQSAYMPRVADGYMSMFGIWASGTVVRCQCDASVFLSPRHYAKWYWPYDKQICAHYDYSIMHIHSCSLHTVDTLLESEYPTAIQITLETCPPGPTLEEMLPTFAKILDVKPLLIQGKLTPAEVDWLYDNLPSGGLAITARDNDW